MPDAGKSKENIQNELDDYRKFLEALEDFIKRQGRILYIGDSEHETDFAPLVGALRCEVLSLQRNLIDVV